MSADEEEPPDLKPRGRANSLVAGIRLTTDSQRLAAKDAMRKARPLSSNPIQSASRPLTNNAERQPAKGTLLHLRYRVEQRHIEHRDQQG